MSREAFNYYFTNLGLTGEPPLAFYDFTAYSTDGGDTYVDSMESGSTTYSGKITSNVESFTGNNSGSGYFTNQHVEIAQTSSLNPSSATILFSHYKSGGNNGTIFSNLSGTSGYEIGINNANKLYFNHYINGQPSIKTFNNIPSETNIYAVTLGAGEVSLQRLNPRAGSSGNYPFDSQSFSIPDYGITNTSRWIIGSGEYQYEGWMDYFLYFDRQVPDANIQTFGNALYKTYSLNLPVTGATLPVLTGIHMDSSGITGEVGKTGIITGQFTGMTGFTYSVGTPVTGTVGISGTIYVPVTGILNKAYTGANDAWMYDTVYQKIQNLNYVLGTGGLEAVSRTGFLSSGSGDFGNWVYDDNTGSYNGVYGSGASGTLFGVTGFSYTPQNIDVTGTSGDKLGTSGVTGIVYSGYTLSGMYTASGVYTGTGYTETVVGDLPIGYNYDYLSNANNDGVTGFFERVMTEERGTINNVGTFKYLANIRRNYIGTTGKRSLDATNFYLNGVSQLSGAAVFSRNAFNQLIGLSQEDYFLSGFTRLVPNQSTVEGTDYPLYDYAQTGHRSGILKITDLSDYASAPFSEITNVSQKQIFFNGVKIYSGRDYVDQGGFFPSGQVTGATGVYFAYPNYEDSTSVTGTDSEVLSITNEYFKPDSYLFYINGIRQAVNGFIEHAGDTDLLSGKQVSDPTLSSLYNHYKLYNPY